jgi:hypothetical protein
MQYLNKLGRYKKTMNASFSQKLILTSEAARTSQSLSTNAQDCSAISMPRRAGPMSEADRGIVPANHWCPPAGLVPYFLFER